MSATASFLGLPPELEAKIHEETVHADGSVDWHAMTLPLMRRQPHLYVACSQIRLELSEDTYLKINTFCFPTPLNIVLLRTVPSETLRKIRTLEVQNMLDSLTSRHWNSPTRLDPINFTPLTHLPNLKHLILDIGDISRVPGFEGSSTTWLETPEQERNQHYGRMEDLMVEVLPVLPLGTIIELRARSKLFTMELRHGFPSWKPASQVTEIVAKYDYRGGAGLNSISLEETQPGYVVIEDLPWHLRAHPGLRWRTIAKRSLRFVRKQRR